MMFKDLLEVANNFGVFETIKQKLINQPDPAAKHLTEVVGELSKAYRAIDDELAEYLSIWFDKDDNRGLVDQRKLLIKLKGGKVEADMAEIRPSCKKIKSIYERFLKGWLTNTLRGEEANKTKDIFEKFDIIDDAFILAADELASWLTKKANSLLIIVNNRNWQTANNKIIQDEQEISSTRYDLTQAIKKLHGFKADFMEISKAI